MSELQGYEMVKDRIVRFYEKYPEGRLVTEAPQFVQLAGKDFVLIRGLAYRDQEDFFPATGTAMEPIPGLNAFSRNSEVEVGETSAIGRALAMLGLGGDIATRDEIQAKGAVEPKVNALSVAANEFIAWVSAEKIPADKIKLTLGSLGVSVGNKRLKTVLTSMSDEQIAVLKEKLS